MWFNILITEPQRPNKVSDNKNLDYHLKCGRFYFSQGVDFKHNDFIMHSMVNWSFYRGNQWIYEEDLDTFLMDESGEVRNRIRWKENIIRPLVRQLKNNAIRIAYNYEAKAINPMAYVRQENELANLLGIQYASSIAPPNMAQILKSSFPIGEDEFDTEDLFSKTYQDKYTEAINNLISYISEINRIERVKVRLAEHLAVDGICVSKETEHHGKQKWEVIIPISFIWDKNAKDPSLQDGEFMGHVEMVSPTDIYARKPDMSFAEKDAIENYLKTENSSVFNFITKFGSSSSGRVPLYTIQWRDTEKQEWGWVKNEAGVEAFVRVNFKEGKYKTKDLILPSEKSKRKELNNDKILVRYPTVTKFIEFVPREVVKTSTGRDIVLGWGTILFSENDYMSPSPHIFSYKVATFQYYDGEVSSILDDVIDPQRMINRSHSMVEAQMNNSRGSGTIIDSSVVDPKGGQEEIIRSINLSKPIFVEAQGNLNNSIGTYDLTIGKGSLVLTELANKLKMSVRENTGVNEAMQGTVGGQRELVGVTNAMIERGSLMQEDFYWALGDVMEQMYQSMASRGKQIFIDSGAIFYAVGENNARPLILTQEYLMEQFRVVIKRTQPEADQKLTANALAIQFMQIGLLDKDRFAKVFNRGTVDDVVRGMREYTTEQQIIQRQMSQQQLGAAGGQMQQQNQMQQQQQQVPYDQMASQQQMKEQELKTRLAETAIQAAAKQQPTQQ